MYEEFLANFFHTKYLFFSLLPSFYYLHPSMMNLTNYQTENQCIWLQTYEGKWSITCVCEELAFLCTITPPHPTPKSLKPIALLPTQTVSLTCVPLINHGLMSAPRCDNTADSCEADWALFTQ